MGLDEDQAGFLSNLVPGRAIVFNGDWTKAVQVQIAQKYRTDAISVPDEDSQLRAKALEFYAESYQRGVFGMSHLFKSRPSVEELTGKAKQGQELGKAFRMCDGKSSKMWSPVLLPWLCSKFGEATVTEALSAAGVVKELSDIVTKSVKIDDLNLPVLTRLCKKHTPEVALGILLVRLWSIRELHTILPKYVAFIADYEAKNIEEVKTGTTTIRKIRSRECLYEN